MDLDLSVRTSLFNTNEFVLSSISRVLGISFNVLICTDFGLEVMYERNAHNVPLDFLLHDP